MEERCGLGLDMPRSPSSSYNFFHSGWTHLGVALLVGGAAFATTALVSKWVKKNYLSLWPVGAGVGAFAFVVTISAADICLSRQMPRPGGSTGTRSYPGGGGGDDGPGGLGGAGRPRSWIAGPDEEDAAMKGRQLRRLRETGPSLLSNPEAVYLLTPAERDNAIKEYILNGLCSEGEAWEGAAVYFQEFLSLTTEEERAAAVQAFRDGRAFPRDPSREEPAVRPIPPVVVFPAGSQNGEAKPVALTLADVAVNEEKLKECPPDIDLSAMPMTYRNLDCETLGNRLTEALDRYDLQLNELGQPKRRDTLRNVCASAAQGREGATDRVLLERLRYVLWLIESDEVSNAIKAPILVALEDKCRACRPTWNQEARTACVNLMGGEEGRGTIFLSHYVQALKENLIREYLTKRYNPSQHHCFNYVERHLYGELGLDRQDGLADHYGENSWCFLNLNWIDHRTTFIQEFKRDYWNVVRIVNGLREQLNLEQVNGINSNIQLMLFGLIPEDGDADDYSSLWVQTTEAGAKLTEAGVTALLVRTGFLIPKRAS